MENCTYASRQGLQVALSCWPLFRRSTSDNEPGQGDDWLKDLVLVNDIILFFAFYKERPCPPPLQ